jgi:taurine transport system permease protein
MRHVIVPNSLPEIFTGARVAMGVCWGTVVAAELVAAEGRRHDDHQRLEVPAHRHRHHGHHPDRHHRLGIDILMRMAEKWLVPWKGRG